MNSMQLKDKLKEEVEMDIKSIRLVTNNVCECPSKTIDSRL